MRSKTTRLERRETAPLCGVAMVTLRVENLVKKFGESTAVDDVTFEVPEGRLFTLLGPSGCGKTTTLRMIAGLERPSSGHVLFDGRKYTDVPPYRRNIGMVFQGYALFPHMTVFDNIAYGLRTRGADSGTIRGKVNDVLDLVGLEGMRDRRPGQMSGGQQQRVAIARALVYDPQVLLLDEPLSNLDAKLRVHMREEIRRIQQNAGITAVYVTHDQEEALSISDLVAVMHSGKISQVGRPEQVYEEPASVRVAGFIGRANFVKARIIEAGTDAISVSILDNYHVQIPRAHAVGDFSCGQKALLFFRPQRAQLSLELIDNSFPATVTAMTYLGETVRYTLQLGDGTEIGVTQDRLTRGLQHGSMGFVRVSPEAARLFPSEQRNEVGEV